MREKLGKIQLCEAKISVTRVGSRTLARGQETIESCHRKPHLGCYRSPRSYFGHLQINRVVFLQQIESSSNWSQMYYLNAPEKTRKNYKWLRNRTENIIFKETILIVCTLSNSGNGKARNAFFRCEYDNEKVQWSCYDTLMLT